MAIVKMIKFFPNSEGRHEGDIFEYPDPTTLLRDGYVEVVVKQKSPTKVKKEDRLKKFFGTGGDKNESKKNK